MVAGQDSRRTTLARLGRAALDGLSVLVSAHGGFYLVPRDNRPERRQHARGRSAVAPNQGERT